MVFVVAEIGVNWTFLETAKEMIKVAKDIGCDAVKTQIFKDGDISSHPRATELKEMVLNEDSFKELFQFGRGLDIEVFATPMYIEAVDWLEDIGVKRYKIRCTDNQNEPLIKKVIATDKPIAISMEGFIPVSKIYNYEKFYETLCIPKYPPRPEDFDIQRLNHNWKGYSNHYPNVLMPTLVTAAIGKDGYLEVHVKNTDDNIDAPVSLSWEQLKELICNVRYIEKLEGFV